MKKKILLFLTIFALFSCKNTGVKKYTITFKNDNGDILEVVEVVENKKPIYSKEEPRKDAMDNNHRYVYIGWDQAIKKATANMTYVATYEYVYLLGSYPNELVSPTSSIAEELENITEDPTTGYKSYDGKLYKTIIAQQDFTSNKKIKVKEGDTCNFSVDPIEWKILGDENVDKFLTTYKLLDISLFNSDTTNGTYINNYGDSEIRTFLTGDFFNSAFSDSEKSSIAQITVDNSAASTCDVPNKYTCTDTNDKIFLLSRQEIRNPAYGFDSSDRADKKRDAITTDYARAKGALLNPNGTSVYWLRSPADNDWTFDENNYAYNVLIGGGIIANHVYETKRCIRPAIKLA